MRHGPLPDYRRPRARRAIAILCSLILTWSTGKTAPCGDADGSLQVDITDAVYLINYIFAGGPAPIDDAGGDFDCSQQTDITDAVFMINFIFVSGPAPCTGAGCVVGVLLEGSPESAALSALIAYGPIAADSAEIDSAGHLRSRLSGVLNPTATVGEVNTALGAVGGRLCWMNPGELFVTIAIAPVATAEEADSLGALLVTSGAFLFADAAFSVDFDGTATASELPPNGQQGDIVHLQKMRMPAAWNARKLVEDNNADVTVFIPDGYYRAVPHPEIPSQVFVSGTGRREMISTVDGNHGFCTSGIVGANFDNQNATGVHPGPSSYLDIRSMMIGGLSYPEMLSQIAGNMPPGRIVLNTSIGFSTDIAGFSKAKRAIQALSWRHLVRARESDFIHITSAGNEGANADDSRYASLSSPFTVAAAYATPFDLYNPGEIGTLDSLALLLFWNYYYAVSPDNALTLNNVILVGSSDATGNESWFSNRGAPVRVLGEAVAAPCVRSDPPSVNGGCTPTANGLHLAHYDGTSFAAPQVAGLAAYLLSLDPNLSNSEIKDLIQGAFTNSAHPGFVDAYLAVLALDKDLGDAGVRAVLLDVANSSDAETPDGQFDEHDLQMFLTKFAEYEQVRAGIPNAPADYSRYDLNGDGFTGGNYAVKFDLDVNDPPQFSLLSTPINAGFLETDETQAIDLDVLCYYGHSSLYVGSLAERDSLLGDCACSEAKDPQGVCGLWILKSSFPDYLIGTSSGTLSTRVGRLQGQDTLWQAGIAMNLTTTGGTPAVSQGTTDLNGFFNTSVTKDGAATRLRIDIEALSDTELVATGSEAAWLTSAVEPLLQGGEFCVVGECANSLTLEPIDVQFAGSALACEGYADGTIVSSALSCTSALTLDPNDGSLQGYDFSIFTSGSPTVQVVHTTGETCYASGNCHGGLVLRFAVHQSVQFVYTPQTSIPSYPDAGHKVKLRIIGGSFLIDQDTSVPAQPIQDVTMTLDPGQYELSASGGACCGATEHLSFNVQFVPPAMAGAVRAIGQTR